MTTPKLHSKYNKPNRNQLAQFVRYVINNYIIAVVAVIISNYISNNSDCYGVTRRRLLGMEVCPTTIPNTLLLCKNYSPYINFLDTHLQNDYSTVQICSKKNFFLSTFTGKLTISTDREH